MWDVSTTNGLMIGRTESRFLYLNQCSYPLRYKSNVGLHRMHSRTARCLDFNKDGEITRQRIFTLQIGTDLHDFYSATGTVTCF